METNTNPIEPLSHNTTSLQEDLKTTKTMGSKSNFKKFSIVVLCLVIFLSVTYLMFPRHYFKDFDSFSYNGSYITWLPTETNQISDQEILQKSAYLEFNWLILSPWHAWQLMDQKINCRGMFWFCPQNQQFRNFLAILVVYFFLFTTFIFWKSKLRYPFLLVVFIAYGLVGLKMTQRYLYSPLQFHNGLLQQFSNVSKKNPFPDGFQISRTGKYEDKDSELKLAIANKRESNGYLEFSIFNVLQDDTRFKQIINGREYCNDRINNKITREISNNLYYCEFSTRSGSTGAAVYGFLDADRKIFLIYYNNIMASESIESFKLSISSFLNFYNIQPNFAAESITDVIKTTE